LSFAIRYRGVSKAILFLKVDLRERGPVGVTKEEVFRSAEGGFAVGFALPPEDGNLEQIHVVELEVLSRKDDAGKLGTQLVAALGTKPARPLLERGEQLKSLFDNYSEKDMLLAIVVKSAHLLTPNSIYDLRVMTEYSHVPYRAHSPAIVLLGHVNEIEESIDRFPGVAMRSVGMPVPKPRLVTW
jgi:hypothetical protein